MHFKNIMDTLSSDVASTSLTASTSDNIILNIVEGPPTDISSTHLNPLNPPEAASTADNIILNVIDESLVASTS